MRQLVVLLVVAACGGGAAPAECTDGDSRPCYSGQPGTENVGVCAPGAETCSGGHWPGVCLGDITPFVERCNDLDDDCDGVVDDAEHAGEGCTGVNSCPGQRACAHGELTCVAPPENECGLCGGPPVSGLGSDCTDGICPGTLVCSMDQTSAVCNVPAQNECELCGGPPVPDLGTVCMAGTGCAGRLACTTSGTTSFCDCSTNICNDGGTIRPVISPDIGDLVITEVMPSPSKVSDAMGEWFEVKVMRDVDLNNLGLDRAGDTLNPNFIRVFDCIHVTAGSYVVFAKDSDPAMNGGLPAVTATFTFSLVTAGNIQLVAGSTIVDAVAWPSARNGKALSLDPDATDASANDDPANFCDATTTYGLGDFGTPAAANPQCVALPPPGQCDDGVAFRAIVPPAPGQLVITEIMPNPKVEPAEEWFEITNTGATPFDLNGLGLDRPNDARAPDVVSSPQCKSVAPGGFALLAHQTTNNAGLPAVDATFGLVMPNTSGGEVQVVDPTTCSGTPITCATVYDSVPWAASSDGVSSQLMPGMFTTTANDNPANFCAAITPYGDATNLGTPKAANVCI